ncbi:winged helix-turn-helix transcriptional regulator [Actinoplanes sp. GCM10030250]|uniref:winged helix-turn-helix transcriptional regulator n=1 Tax=Actinoplanes sp. GCM10030250 TaxID=3273376 RepID=UPI00360E95AD
MRGYGQYCPIALAAEVFAERWTPIIIRNLHLGCERFTEILDGAPGLPRSVLSQRLRSLERTGVVHRTRTGRATAYTLTACGRELAEVCLTLGAWGARWREARPEDQDPYLALWTLSRMIVPGLVPRPRVVVRFQITDRPPPNLFWLVLSRTGNEVCAHSPGFPEDGQITTDTAGLVRWYASQSALTGQITAPRWLRDSLTLWGRLNPFSRTTDGVPAVAGARPGSPAADLPRPPG